LKNLPRITDKAWSSSVRFGTGTNNTSPEKHYEKLDGFFGTIYAKGRYYGIFISESLEGRFILGSLNGKDATLKTEPYFKLR
jgi:hypothetical protein